MNHNQGGRGGRGGGGGGGRDEGRGDMRNHERGNEKMFHPNEMNNRNMNDRNMNDRNMHANNRMDDRGFQGGMMNNNNRNNMNNNHNSNHNNNGHPFPNQMDQFHPNFQHQNQHHQQQQQHGNKAPVPCPFFNQPQGCKFGDGCRNIHDPRAIGVRPEPQPRYLQEVDNVVVILFNE